MSTPGSDLSSPPDRKLTRTSTGSGRGSIGNILSGGLWRSSGKLIIDEADVGEWLDRCELEPNLHHLLAAPAAPRALTHAHAFTSRGSGALWKHTGPTDAPLGTAGIFERLFTEEV